jgi:ferredoxin
MRRLLTGVALGLVVWQWPSAWRFVAPALSPFLAICSPLAVRSLSFASLFALPMLVLAIFRRRFWCRNLCPVGLISETCGKLRARRSPGATLPFTFPVSRWLVLTTLAGAVVAYPLFLWMDPLALFSGFFGVAHAARYRISPLSVAGLPIVMLISFLFPGIWCTKICPLGGMQDLLALAGRGRRRVQRTEPGLQPAMGVAARRSVLALAIGAVISVFVPKAWGGKRRPLRPPGSVGETAFQGGCIRCGSCVRVCPSGIIEPASDRSDVAGFLVPKLHFSGTRFCLQDCNRCGQVCPTGVIQALSLEAKNRCVIGVAVIDLSACLLAADVECGVCLPRCPRAAIEEVFSYETYTTALQVARARCNGCGACVGICPPKVITIVR